MPEANPDGSLPAGSQRPATGSEPALGPVLLVEDDEVLATILARHLRTHGYGVEVRSRADDALKALDGGLRPCIVVLDINLPDATGWLLPGSRQLAAAGDPPVLIASASTVSSARIAQEHVAGYLPKPFPLETFMAVVGRLAHRQEAVR